MNSHQDRDAALLTLALESGAFSSPKFKAENI